MASLRVFVRRSAVRGPDVAATLSRMLRGGLVFAASCGVVALALAAAQGCGGQTHAGPPTVADADSGKPFVPLDDAGTCGVTTRRYELGYAVHVDQGTPLTHVSNPPCGGNHYPIWALFRSHPKPVPRGNWIHNLEHGGVVFLYRCASRAACPDLAAKLEALAQALPADPACVSPVRNRIVVTPDPNLPEGVQFAAAAWGYNLVARCFDEDAFRGFYTRRFGRGPESTCAEGFVMTKPGDAGTD